MIPHNTLPHPKRPMRKLALIAAVLCAYLFLPACASVNSGKTNQNNSGLLAQSVESATQRLGPADSTVTQEDGLIRHAWIYHQERHIPPKIVRKLFHRGSFPSDAYYEIPGRIEREYCFFTIITRPDGQMESISQEGNACELLRLSGTSGIKRNSLPTTPLVQVP